ncbi:amidohydrolase [Mycoplasma hafezii]|uniref:amidohydrolase n=1 Tax=Mycoplasma hafezii TaxID=525886 RepID=UPI003CF0E355
MNQIWIKNARVLTMDEPLILENQNIYITDNKIKYVGSKELDDFIPTKTIDAKHNLVMPGLINSHTHISMTLLRNFSDDLNLEDWLFNHIFPIEDKFTEKDIYLGAKLGAAEMIASGTTSFIDMYFFANETAKMCEEMNVRGFIGMGLAQNSIDQRFSQVIEMFKRFDNSNLVTPILAPHAVYTNNEYSFSKIKELQTILNNPLMTIHLNESKSEINNCIKETSYTPIEWMNHFGLLNEKTIIAHGTYLSEKEIKILNKTKSTIVHNPISNLKLASGIALISSYIKNGINVTLGTDGAASNNTLDMFETIKITSLLAKGITLNPTELNAFETLKLATTNAAKSLGMEKQLGKIKAGYLADLIFIDLDNIHHTPNNNILNSLVYSTTKSDVYTTIINGQVVYENREFKIKDFDINDLRTEIQNRMNEITK